MIAKLLIANRGEIACRIVATCRRIGVQTVAVYSDADAQAKHVAMAHEAVYIGPAAPAESYLRGDRILDAAQTTGADAIHPGYGFLSENPDFAEAVEAAGLIFVGPSAKAIRAMGLKDAAKQIMLEAGVPIVPGYHGADQDPDRLAAEAAKIGYPVLIKARAGGGGKGIRRVDVPSAFLDALEGAQREALASFGDPVCLIEKYISHPRHIEVQVFGDANGTVVHLFERDCSLQRRHQKVIEEAPAPGMTAQMRTAMCQAAVEAARAIGYVGAGTVEFIVDGSGPLHPDKFWFMEMNTRLQVEHPVSEAITGIDFVDLQLHIATGAPLPFAQDDLKIDGWSFEARIYAEDPAKGFLPAIGELSHLASGPAASFTPGVTRLDSGVRQGDQISPWYDPMIAKLITHGPTRAAALNQLRHALADFEVLGVATNLGVLRALANHQAIQAGEVDTGLIARHGDGLTKTPEPSLVDLGVAALKATGVLRDRSNTDPWDGLIGWRHWGNGQFPVTLSAADQIYDLTITLCGQEVYEITCGDETRTLSVVPINQDPKDQSSVRVIHDGQSYSARVVNLAGRVAVFAKGQTHVFELPDPLDRTDTTQSGADMIQAPMPGLVKALTVQSGSKVQAGEAVAVLEAMKMEHTLTAPRDGIVDSVTVSAGDQVTDGTVLLWLEKTDG